MADDNNRTQKTDTTMFPVCCILIGAVFLLFPEWVMGTLSFILGGLCILYGAWKLIGALRGSGFTRGGAVLGGTAAVLLGIYVIRHPAQIFSLLPLVAGVFFLLDGVDRIRCAAAMHRAAHTAVGSAREAAMAGKQKKRFYSACIIGMVTLLCGVILLMRPFDAISLTLRVVGFLVLCNGIGALWTAHALDVTNRLFGVGGDTPPRSRDGKYEASFRDITDESNP
ncbi:MAG: DUF308 domain-containing protein [Clostridia bacterium]|nr:DUF308 domain-containing protein [Clostridia bacterium]